jgi:hypothetical protein
VPTRNPSSLRLGLPSWTTRIATPPSSPHVMATSHRGLHPTRGCAELNIEGRTVSGIVSARSAPSPSDVQELQQELKIEFACEFLQEAAS